MAEKSYSLLREKFVIRPNSKDGAHKTALSNRLVLNLVDTNSEIIETYIIRAQNMHSTVRMAAKMVQDFDNLGPIGVRESTYLHSTWEDVLNHYERRFNHNLWIAVYKDGQLVYTDGEHHPFLDIIEQCDQHEKGDYERSIKLAEAAFNKAGQDVSINYHANIAMNLDADGAAVRCSLLVRNARATKTFSASIQAADAKKMNISHVMSAAAAFLEGVELCHMIGMNTIKIMRGIITTPSNEETQTIEARKRITELDQILDGLEHRFTLRYRPERPAFELIIEDIEKIAQKLFPPEEGEEEESAPV